jgi:hypothetical protein
MMVDMEQASDPVPGIPMQADGLAQIAAFVRFVDHLGTAIDKREAELSELKRNRDAVLERELPELFAVLGVDSVTVDGRKVSIDRDAFDYSIAGEKAGPAIDWLEANGHSAMVKRTVSAALGRDSKALLPIVLLEMRAALAKYVSPDNISQSTKVEASTLGAFLREMTKAKRPFPDQLFGYTPRPTAKIGRKSKPKEE